MSGGFLGKLWNIADTLPVSVFIVNSFFLLKPREIHAPPSLKWTSFATHTLLRFPAGAHVKIEGLTWVFFSRSGPLDGGNLRARLFLNQISALTGPYAVK